MITSQVIYRGVWSHKSKGVQSMDKVISEFRLVETDDGFRIEVKGDKEAMRKMWRVAEPFHRHSRRRGWRHGGFPFHMPDFFCGWGAGGMWGEEGESEEEPGDEPASAAL